jgi:2-polyprenyl-3-methyl-5-hydroxy-6-metoxy-1,4-benzoquinol methylase
MLRGRFRGWWGNFSHKDKLDMAVAPEIGFIDSRDCGLVDAVQRGWYQNDSGELFSGFPISAEDVVLDVGCGAGGATLWAARRGAEVIFTDVVEDKVAILRERVRETSAKSATGMVCDSAPLPIADGTASRVIALEVLEHVDDPAQMMRELVRVGRPGALFLFSVPDARGEMIQKAIAPDAYFAPPNHIHIFERDAFASLVEDAGLEVERHTTYGFYWSLWTMFYWAWARSNGVELRGESLDVANPPYPPLLNDWAKVWHTLIQMPEAAPLKNALDDLLPKSQVIVARKPLGPTYKDTDKNSHVGIA